MNGCNRIAARTLAALAGVTVAAAGASAESPEGIVLSPAYSSELNQRMLDLGITDLRAEFNLAEVFGHEINENYESTFYSPSDPGVNGGADINAFLGIDCIPDVVATISPIGAHQANGRYGEPLTPAEGFLAGSESVNVSGPVTPPGSLLTADSFRATIFGPANRFDDPMTPAFESDTLQDPDFLSQSRWTLRYYKESGDADNLNSPHLPFINDPALDPSGETRIEGDNSQDLIAKFQFVGDLWFEETCVGFDADATPVTGIGVGINNFCINFTGLGPSCLGAVGIEHDPVPMIAGECYWVEFVPEFRQTFDVNSFWVLSASTPSTIGQDNQSWRDTADPLSGFVNGTQGSPDFSICIDINLADEDPNFPGRDADGLPLAPIDAGQNRVDYVASGCSSVVCNTQFGVNDECPEALPVALDSMTGTATVSGTTFCSSNVGADNSIPPDPAATPTGDTVGAFGLVAAQWFSVTGTGNDMAIDLCNVGTDDDLTVSRSWWIAAYCGSECGNGNLFAVASATSFDNLNTDCILPFSNDLADFPRLEFPTSAGTEYKFAIFSELGDGAFVATVEDLGTAVDPMELSDQCDACELSADDEALLAANAFDVIEAEDELSPNSPTGGACDDGFFAVNLDTWRDQTRANDFCSKIADLTDEQVGAYIPPFTPLNGSDQSNIFLPNFDGPGDPGSTGVYNPSAAYNPIQVPATITIRGNIQDATFQQTADFTDVDNYGFYVDQPAVVRFTVTAATDYRNTINTALGKLDPNTLMRDVALGFDCDTTDSQSDGGGAAGCDAHLNSTVCFPGEFYYLTVSVPRERKTDCTPALRPRSRYFGTVEMFNCPTVIPTGTFDSASDGCNNLDMAGAFIPDSNRGCNADVETDNEQVIFDQINLNTPFVGQVGESPDNGNNPVDLDWAKFTAPASGTVNISAEYFSDLYVEIFQPADPGEDGNGSFEIEIPELYNQCGGPTPNPIIVGCAPVTAVFDYVFANNPSAPGECTTESAVSVTGLTPGTEYWLRIQLGEQLLGDPGAGNAGRGLRCGEGVDDYVLLVEDPGGEFDACTVADVTSTGATLEGQAGFGIPDGNADLDDLGYFLGFWLSSDASVADVTTTGATLAGQPGFGAADGNVDLDDLGFFLSAWLEGCP